MSLARKRHFVDALKDQLRSRVSSARDAEVKAASAVEAMREEARTREDAKAATPAARLAAAHEKRRQEAAEAIETLIEFARTGLREFPPDHPVALGALVDVEVWSPEASEERSLFVLPVGAGCELEGPGGDGALSVVTPQSAVGRQLIGARTGDSFETLIQGKSREWTLTFVC